MKIKSLLIILLFSKSVFSQTDSNKKSNISPLRGMTANLFKDLENTEMNFAFQIKIRNVFQENGLIKISLYTKIDEPDMYLQHNCAKDGFDLYKNSRSNPKKDFFYNSKLQSSIRNIYCVKTDSGKQKLSKSDFDDISTQNLAENRLEINELKSKVPEEQHTNVELKETNDLDGLYSKFLDFIDCNERPILCVFSKGNEYIYLYKDNTANFITYSLDSFVINKNIHKYRKIIRVENNRETTILEFEDLNKLTKSFTVITNGYGEFRKLISLKDESVYNITPQRADKEYVKSPKKIFDYLNIRNKTVWFKTPLEVLKYNKNEIINIFNYFYNNLQPNEIFQYYNKEMVDGITGKKYFKENLFKEFNYTLNIDEKSNIIYLLFTPKEKWRKYGKIFAIHPILGPLPFIKSDSSITYFDSYKCFFKPIKDLKKIPNEAYTPSYELSFDVNDKIPEQNFGYIKFFNFDNLNKSINSSLFFLDKVETSSFKENYRYFPPKYEKDQLYKINAISLSQLIDNNFNIIKERTVPVFSYYLKTLTGFNLFHINGIEGFFPLENSLGIFKRQGKFGIIDLSDKNWKSKDFIIIENTFDAITFIKPNVLKGLKDNIEIYFDYYGNIIEKIK